MSLISSGGACTRTDELVITPPPPSWPGPDELVIPYSICRFVNRDRIWKHLGGLGTDPERFLDFNKEHAKQDLCCLQVLLKPSHCCSGPWLLTATLSLLCVKVSLAFVGRSDKTVSSGDTNHVHLSSPSTKIPLLYLHGSLLPRFVSIAPLAPHACVGRNRAFAELLWSKISNFFLLHRLQVYCTSTRAILSIFGKPVLPQCFSSIPFLFSSARSVFCQWWKHIGAKRRKSILNASLKMKEIKNDQYLWDRIDY